MDANKIKIAVTTEGRLFFLEENPKILGFMYVDESIKKKSVIELPKELISFFRNYGSNFTIGAENFFKNAFVQLIHERVEKKIHLISYAKKTRKINYEDITGKLLKNDLSVFDRTLYRKVMTMIVKLSGVIIKLFKNDQLKLKKLKNPD